MNRIASQFGWIIGCIYIAYGSQTLSLRAESPVAAKVGNDTISTGEVQHELKGVLGDRKLETQERNVLEAQTLGLLVNRQLVVRFLENRKAGASESDLNQAVDGLKKQLAVQKRTLAEQCTTLGITEAEIRRLYAWKIGWPKYLALKLIPENTTKYFEANRRHFDGTQLQVRHLLLKVADSANHAQVEEISQQAVKIREEILAHKLTFEEAAKKYSQAATAPQGGDLGLIGRHAPMPASFNDAAFELKAGDTSEPVVTNFGVHLIHCVKVEPGKLALQDANVEQAVREDLIRYLFNTIADQQRKDVKIEFTGAMPYLKPDTKELVIPSANTSNE